MSRLERHGPLDVQPTHARPVPVAPEAFLSSLNRSLIAQRDTNASSMERRLFARKVSVK